MTDHTTLKKGDRDESKKWGGKILPNAPIYTVSRLQKDLKAVGVFAYKVDGDFGTKTEKALKIFQWVCANSLASIKSGVRTARNKNVSVILNGMLDLASYNELTAWVDKKQIVTGDLIQIPFTSLSNIEASSGFKKIDSPKVTKKEIVISKDALTLLKEMNKQAKINKLTIKVNQALRLSNVKVTGAVVTPATKSQHLIGHAIDCNLVDGNNWNNSTTFKQQKETINAKEFIKAIKAASPSYRWGGNFNTVDTPHFDTQLNASSFDYDAKFFLNQRMISEKQEIPIEKL